MCSDGVTPSVSTRVRKRPGVRLGDAPVEDQLHLVGPAQVQVLADDFLEEDAAGQRSVQHLGQGELGLQDGHVVAVAGLPVGAVNGCGSRASHLRSRASILGADRPSQSCCNRWGSAQEQDAVVQRLEGDAFLGQLPLDVLVPVDAQLGVVGEVGAELEEEGAEVVVDAVEVEVVDHRRVLTIQG